MKNNNRLLILATILTFVFASCKKDEQLNTNTTTDNNEMISEKGANPDETAINDENARHHHGGFLYTMSNAAGQNEILCYRIHSDGSLTLESTTPTGGAGAGAPLGSQGSIELTDNGHKLFAVNAGDNTISSFQVHNDGSLTLLNTVGSEGIMPVSLCVHHHHLYVVNAGSDNIAGYTVDAAGVMTLIPGSVQSLSAAGSAPAQISFSPNGHRVLVTEKMTNMISIFALDATGAAGPATSVPSVGLEPFGFKFARGYMVVSNGSFAAPNASTVTSYALMGGTLNDVNGAVPNGQTAACWVATTKYERFAYISNTMSNTISSYYVSPWGAIYLIHGAAATAAGPLDICVAENNYFVYSINSGDHTIGGYHRAFLGDLDNMGNTPGLPDFAAGIAIK
jgi:6-phosphogluconolactonase